MAGLPGWGGAGRAAAFKVISGRFSGIETACFIEYLFYWRADPWPGRGRPGVSVAPFGPAVCSRGARSRPHRWDRPPDGAGRASWAGRPDAVGELPATNGLACAAIPPPPVVQGGPRTALDRLALASLRAAHCALLRPARDPCAPHDFSWSAGLNLPTKKWRKIMGILSRSGQSGQVGIVRLVRSG